MPAALVAAAVGYLNAGLSVIALVGKLPNATHHEHGVHSAIKGTVESDADRALLETVFEDGRTTGIGIAIPEHIVVIDIDGEEGAEAWQELVAADEFIPRTPVAKTARGLHAWFLAAQPGRNGHLAPKLDIKSVGGYVAVEPSWHPGSEEQGVEPGYHYEWLIPLVGEDGIIGPIDWLPDVIEAHLATVEDLRTNVVTRRDGPSSLKGLARFVHDADEGNRNAALFWSACVARDEGYSRDAAMTALLEATTLPRDEATKTIRSAFSSR